MCKAPHCNKHPHGHGLCATHYAAWRRNEGASVFGFCSVDECNKPRVIKELCNKHYLRLLRWGEIADKPTVCGVEGCGRVSNCKSLCRMHYTRLKRWGDVNIKHRHTHSGNSSHELYSIYDSMKQRCLNSNNPGYKNYGGRGIKVSERWLGMDGFTNFLDDMGKRPTGLTLERIDVNGNYEPPNCKWATWVEQANNKRINNVTVKEV